MTGKTPEVIHDQTIPISPESPLTHRGRVKNSYHVCQYTYVPASLGLEVWRVQYGERIAVRSQEIVSAIKRHYARGG